MNTNERQLKVLRRQDVQRKLGLSRSTLYAYLDEKSPQFKAEMPRPFKIGSMVAFFEHELDDYLLVLASRRSN